MFGTKEKYYIIGDLVYYKHKLTRVEGYFHWWDNSDVYDYVEPKQGVYSILIYDLKTRTRLKVPVYGGHLLKYNEYRQSKYEAKLLRNRRTSLF